MPKVKTTMRLSQVALMCILALTILFSTFLSDAASAQPSTTTAPTSALYPDSWVPGFGDASGRFLQDFSYAGYELGADIPEGAALPQAMRDRIETLAPSGGDDTTAIQQKINTLCQNGGGTLQLGQGTFRVKPAGTTPTYAVWVWCSNLLIQGEGPDKTQVLNIADPSVEAMTDKNVFFFGPGNNSGSATSIPTFQERRWNDADSFGALCTTATPLAAQSIISGSNKTLTTDFGSAQVREGSRQISVSNTTGLSVGQWIVVRSNNADTAAPVGFRTDHSMDNPRYWCNQNAHGLLFLRKIDTVLDSTTLLVDIPIRYELKVRDAARLFRLRIPPLERVALQDMAIGMKPDPNNSTTTTNKSSAIKMNHVANGWVKNVRSVDADLSDGKDLHVLSNGIELGFTRSITIDQVVLERAQNLGGGGNGYLFFVMGSETLIRNSVANRGRHNFLMERFHATGNVISNSVARSGLLCSESHAHLSPANLVDGLLLDGDCLRAVNRGPDSSDAGYTASQWVFWNIRGKQGRCQTFPTEVIPGSISSPRFGITSQQVFYGYVIGVQGTCQVALSPIVDIEPDPNNTPDYLEHAPGFVATFTPAPGSTAPPPAVYPASLYYDQFDRRVNKAEIVIEHSDPVGAVAVGTWTNVFTRLSPPSVLFDAYAQASGGSSGTQFRFTPQLPWSAFYEVYAAYPALPTNSAQVTYELQSDLQPAPLLSVQRNQTVPDGGGMLLGCQWLDAGLNLSLVVRADTATSGSVIADAVRFKRVSACAAPTATITPSLTESPSTTSTSTPTTTETATRTLTATPTLTRTATPSSTVTLTATITPSTTRTLTVTPSLTRTPTHTATPTLASGGRQRDTIGAFRPSTGVAGSFGTFYLRNSNSAGAADLTVTLNFSVLANDIPLTGDWNGDGVDTVGVFHRANRQYELINVNASAATSTIRAAYGAANALPVVGDWNGDGKDTIAVYTASNGLWLFNNANLAAPTTTASTVFGSPGDIPIAGDWDADGFDTIGVFRPSTGQWRLTNTRITTVNQTVPAATVIFSYGNAGETGQVVTGWWNPTGGARVGLYRVNEFQLRYALAAGAADLTFVFGQAGDLPVAGRWAIIASPTATPTPTSTNEIAPTFDPNPATNTPLPTNTPSNTPTVTITPSPTVTQTPSNTPSPTSGGITRQIDTIGTFRPSTGAAGSFGTFYLRGSNSTGMPDRTVVLGFSALADDIPLAGDWNGDGIDTVGVFHRATRLYEVVNVNTDAAISSLKAVYGVANALPVVGDWNGDGRDTIAIYNPASSLWLFSNASLNAPTTTASTVFGTVGDIPVAGDWDADGFDTIGVFRPSTGQWRLTNTRITTVSQASPAASIIFTYGNPAETGRVVTGWWNTTGGTRVGLYRAAEFQLRYALVAGAADLTFLFGQAGDIPVAGRWGNIVIPTETPTLTPTVTPSSQPVFFFRAYNVGGIDKEVLGEQFQEDDISTIQYINTGPKATLLPTITISPNPASLGQSQMLRDYRTGAGNTMRKFVMTSINKQACVVKIYLLSLPGGPIPPVPVQVSLYSDVPNSTLTATYSPFTPVTWEKYDIGGEVLIGSSQQLTLELAGAGEIAVSGIALYCR